MFGQENIALADMGQHVVETVNQLAGLIVAFALYGLIKALFRAHGNHGFGEAADRTQSVGLEPERNTHTQDRRKERHKQHAPQAGQKPLSQIRRVGHKPDLPD